MNYITTFIEKLKTFFFTYKWLLVPLIPTIIFIGMIVYIFAAQGHTSAHNATTQSNTEISQAPGQNAGYPQQDVSLSPSEQPEISPDDGLQAAIEQETSSIATGQLKFEDESDEAKNDNAYPDDDEVAEGSISTKTLPDGSTEYQYPSDDPNRTHMQILKNNTVVFRRNLMPDTTISDYSTYFTNPEYTSQGSAYYGSSAEILATPTQGIAIVEKPSTGEVYEQYLFPAMSVTSYLQKFGKDITSYSP